MKKKLAIILMALIGLVSCEDDVLQYQIDDDLIKAYISDNDIDATKHASGLYYKILKEGDQDNKPNYGSVVSAKYKGYYMDGEVFDDSEGSIVQFSLQGVIQGWTYGIPLIGKGGKILLILPSDLAYGATGYSDIPANAILVFEVELIAITA